MGNGSTWSQTKQYFTQKSSYPNLSNPEFISFVASEVHSQSNIEAAVIVYNR